VLNDADVPQAQSLVHVTLELLRHTLGPHSDDGEAALYRLGRQHGAGRDRIDNDEDVTVGRCATRGDPLDRVGQSIPHGVLDGVVAKHLDSPEQKAALDCNSPIIRRRATCDMEVAPGK
jgi:hypothetical protein